MFFLKKPLILILVWVSLSILFSITTWLDYTSSRPQASMDPSGGLYEVQISIDEEFPQKIHPIPLEVLGENLLTRKTLFEIKKNSDRLRESEFGKEYLVNFIIPGLGDTRHLGFYSIADGVEQILNLEGSSLRGASEERTKKAIVTLLSDEKLGPYFRSVLSNEAKVVNDKWTSPAFSIFITADNNKLGGGVFRRVVGGDLLQLQKEEFNRDIQSSLSGENYKLLGIGIDLNIEANEEGYSFLIISLIMTLILTLMTFVGVIFRSFKLFLLSGLGLLTLFIWIRGFSFSTFGLVGTSLTTEIILPIAFMAFGIDYLVHVISKYKEENNFTIYQSISTINTSLLLAMVTTAVAFGSNYISKVPAIKSFAITGAFSAISAYFIMGIIIPILFGIFQKSKNQTKSVIQVGWIMNFVSRRRTLVIIFLSLFTLFSIYGITLIEKRLDPKDFISSQSDFVVSLDERDRHFGDTRGEEASIYIKGDFTNPEVQDSLDKIIGLLENNKHLAHTKEGLLILPYGKPEVHKIDNNLYSERIIFEVVNTRKQENIKEALDSLTKDMEIFSNIAEYKIIGSAFTRDESLDSITNSLTETLLLAIILIFIILLFAFRSVLYSIITIIPMLFVVIWTYGAMGLLGFSLNFITATIAAIALGVGIDYSVHIVEAYRREGSIDKVGNTTGFAILISGVSSIIGFIFLSFAPMPLFATYGVLAATMISFSLLASIVILPIILVKFDNLE